MSIVVNSKAGQPPEVLIYGPITARSATNLDKELRALGSISELSIRINSPGGDVFQGSAIYQMLSRVRAFKTVLIEGVAASMASLIAMAGDRILIAENAMLMIHDPSGVAEGGSAAMRRMIDLLDGVKSQMARTYAKRSRKSVAEVEKMMTAETWFTAEEAVKMGFADAVEGEVQAAAFRELSSFDYSQFQHAPLPKTIGEFAEAYWDARNPDARTPAPRTIEELSAQHWESRK